MSDQITLRECQEHVAEISIKLDKAYNEAWDIALVISEQAGDISKCMLHKDSYKTWQEWEEAIATNLADLIVCVSAMYNYIGRDANDYVGKALYKHSTRMKLKKQMNYDKVTLERLAYAHSKGFYLPLGISEKIDEILNANKAELSDSVKSLLDFTDE